MSPRGVKRSKLGRRGQRPLAGFEIVRTSHRAGSDRQQQIFPSKRARRLSHVRIGNLIRTRRPTCARASILVGGPSKQTVSDERWCIRPPSIKRQAATLAAAGVEERNSCRVSTAWIHSIITIDFTDRPKRSIVSAPVNLELRHRRSSRSLVD